MTEWDMTFRDKANKVEISENCSTNGHKVTFTKEGDGRVSFRGTWPYMDFFSPKDRHRELLNEHGYSLAQ